MESNKQAAKKEKEEDSLHELAYAKLDAMWNDVKFMKKLLTRMSELESDKVALWCLFSFSASKSLELGQTKEEFMDAVGLAFDDISDDGEEEEENDNDIISNEEFDIDEETKRLNKTLFHCDDSESAPTEEEE